jgi:hypothetical protein
MPEPVRRVDDDDEPRVWSAWVMAALDKMTPEDREAVLEGLKDVSDDGSCYTSCHGRWALWMLHHERTRPQRERRWERQKQRWGDFLKVVTKAPKSWRRF